MGEGVSELGQYAFLDCRLMHTVEFSPRLTEIQTGVFSGCSALTDARLKDGISVIYQDAFSSCTALGTVRLPRSLDTIYENAFASCTSLTKLIYDGTLEDFAITITIGYGNEALEMAAYDSLDE